MKTRYIIGLLVVGILVGIAAWWSARRGLPGKYSTRPKSSSQAKVDAPSQNEQTTSPAALDAATDSASGEGDLENPDNWWKAPITFYGKVVDEKDRPVSGAKLHITWTDESPKGNSERDMLSDDRGLFSISGIRGKNLGVHVSKPGYYTSRKQRTYFSYAGPEDSFVPDQQNPILFRLRAKGEMPSLNVFELEVPIQLRQPVLLNLATGNVDPTNGQLGLELLVNKGGKRLQREWAIRLTAPQGGVLLSTEEYAFMAPEAGYQPSIEINMQSQKPPTWNGNLYEGGEFFVKTSNGYGRIILKMVVGSPKLKVTTFFNPTGSRNLESEHY